MGHWSQPRKPPLNPTRRLLFAVSLFAIAVFPFSGCNNSPAVTEPTDGTSLQKVRLQLNWFPEAEHGCFYAAKVHGYYEQQGLDVEIIPGGKSTVMAQELTLNRVDFAVANAEDVLAAVQQDAPVISVMASMQHNPRCLLVRKDSGVESFDKLGGLTLMLDSSQAFVAYLKHRGHLNDTVKVVPYFGSIAPLATDKNYGCQGYSFSEPFLAEQQGIAVNILNVTDIGFDPYCSLLITNEKTIKDKPDLVKKFVAASIQGLQAYISEPDKTNAYILEQNKEGMTADALAFGAKAVGELCKVGDGEKLGSMSADRWATLIKQAEEIKFIEPGTVSIQRVFTNEFVGE